MMTSKNACILLCKSIRAPGILSVFNVPRILDKYDLDFEGQKNSVFLIEYPIIYNDITNKRRLGLFKNLINENNIDFIVTKSVELRRFLKLKSPECLEEAAALKSYAALKKISLLHEKRYLQGSFGLIMDSYDLLLLDMLTDEASSIMLYEGAKADRNVKAKIFTDHMEKKGISIVFTKELEKLLRNSDVVFVEDPARLEEMRDLLSDRLVAGKGCSMLTDNSLEDSLIWHGHIEDFSDDNFVKLYNDELIAVLRHYNRELHYSDFTDLLEHVYIYNNKHKWNAIYHLK